jgi:ribosomal protein L12E/L44/L45/RPP1/RPP2
MGLKRLTNDQLMTIYKKAVLVKVEPDFINILLKELKYRGLDETNEEILTAV